MAAQETEQRAADAGSRVQQALERVASLTEQVWRHQVLRPAAFPSTQDFCCVQPLMLAYVISAHVQTADRPACMQWTEAQGA
jgi:hypothetical protein